MPNYVLDEKLYHELLNVIRWKRSFRVTGARSFVNKPDSCTIAIGASTTQPDQQFPAVRYVKCVQNGGAAGSDSTTCTFTYDLYVVTDSGGVTKLNASPVTPDNAVDTNVEYTAGTRGITFQDSAGTWHLFVTDEHATTEDCAALASSPETIPDSAFGF